MARRSSAGADQNRTMRWRSLVVSHGHWRSQRTGVRRETPAVEAAAAIHSDISRGFIRAEVVTHQELLDAGSLAACRQQGRLRLEGKTYVVRDGDVVHYRFNI